MAGRKALALTERQFAVLHVLWERLNWFDKYVKNAPPRPVNNTDR